MDGVKVEVQIENKLFRINQQPGVAKAQNFPFKKCGGADKAFDAVKAAIRKCDGTDLD